MSEALMPDSFLMGAIFGVCVTLLLGCIAAVLHLAKDGAQ